MISDENYDREEMEIRKIFEGTGPAREPEAQSEKRINRIVERAHFESVLKDTTSFVFTSFGSGLAELTGALFGAMTPPGPPGEEEESAKDE